ncbi:Splicing factor 3B subunit 1 [Oopsacas minuta]|uniref:Splicing factor 3B subunit 1 n=1 Tax=Oopsacas minuta TaxID=111878 RepID=A0AAV7JT16_9METZ|nr:Splicing factor 3B subunit 1 [Oopsacas minuta]
MKTFGKTMGKTNSAGFLHLVGKFPKLNEAKLKEGVFVGPQIRQVFRDPDFEKILSELEKSAWNSFKWIDERSTTKHFTDQPMGNLPFLKQEDIQYFGKLLEDIDEDVLPPEEQKELKIMRLLLKIKNGTPPMRKSSLRQITDKAREFGASSLFNQILPLLMSPALEDQERHLLVKVWKSKWIYILS